MFRNLAWLTLLSLTQLPAVAEVHIRPLVMSGDALPGAPDVTIASISWMREDSRGRVVFLAVLQGAVTSENSRAILRAGDNLEILVRAGDPIPGLNATFAYLGSPQVTPGDHVVFSASEDFGATYQWAQFLWREDGVHLVVDGSIPVPGRPSTERFQSITQITATADGHILVAADTSASNPPIRGIWYGEPGSLALIAAPNMQVPGMPPGTLFYWGVWIAEIGSDSALLGGYTNSFSHQCLWRYSAAGFELIARTGDVLPGLLPPDHVTQIGGPGDMSLNGKFVFRGNVPGGEYRYGFWAGPLGALRRVVIAGDAAQDGSTFDTPYDVRISPGGETLFSALMNAPDGSQYWSIWLSRPSGSLLPIAREGSRPPGMPEDYSLVQLGMAGGSPSSLVLRNPTISATGRIVYWGLGSGSGPLFFGLWTGDLDREIELALGTGTTFLGTDGQPHTITRPSNAFELNDSDQLAVLVRTTDAHDAILRVTPPCGCCTAVDIAGNDCRVNVADLSLLLSSFGTCTGLVPADTNSDGCVDLADLIQVLRIRLGVPIRLDAGTGVSGVKL